MIFEQHLRDIQILIDVIKIFFICMFTFYTGLKVINKKINKNYKILLSILLYIIISSIISKTLKKILGFAYCILFIVLSISLSLSKITKNKFIYCLLVIIVSLSMNYIVFIICIVINFIINNFINITNDYINLIIMILLYAIVIFKLLGVKRFKKGLVFLNSKLKDEYFDILILNISINILFIVIIISNYKIKFTGNFIFGLVISSTIMIVTIQKSLQLYYKQKMLVKDLEETKQELESKKQEIEKLERENLNFSKTSHSIAHKQKALEHKINELMKSKEILNDGLKKNIDNISSIIESKNLELELNKTGIEEIDDILNYMQSECIKNNIDFELQIKGNIYYMVNNFIEKEALQILMADHIKNSIIAINNSDNINKSILVRIGIIDGCYSLYVYDSGIEFEQKTLENLGKIPTTTHSDTGGTGMGFMNTFDTLNKYNASMIIKELGKPSKDNYTKVIIIKFDKKNEFKISSYKQKLDIK